MRKYKHKKTGNEFIVYGSINYTAPKEILENSNDWELIERNVKSYDLTYGTSEIISENLKKKPILTTHDGVDLFEGFGSYVVDTDKYNYFYKEISILDTPNSIKNNRIFFSTKEKALEYIEWNEKRYSLNDMKNAGVWDFSIEKIKKLNK